MYNSIANSLAQESLSPIFLNLDHKNWFFRNYLTCLNYIKYMDKFEELVSLLQIEKLRLM